MSLDKYLEQLNSEIVAYIRSSNGGKIHSEGNAFWTKTNKELQLFQEKEKVKDALNAIIEWIQEIYIGDADFGERPEQAKKKLSNIIGGNLEKKFSEVVEERLRSFSFGNKSTETTKTTSDPIEWKSRAKEEEAKKTEKEVIKKNTDSKDNEISSSGSGEKTKPAEKKKEIEETGKRSSPGISSNLADNGNKKKNSWKDGSGEKPNLKKTDNSPQKDIRPVLFWGAIIIVILAIVAFLVYCLVGDEEEKEENVNEESKKDSKINKENNNQKKKRRKKEGFK